MKSVEKQPPAWVGEGTRRWENPRLRPAPLIPLYTQYNHLSLSFNLGRSLSLSLCCEVTSSTGSSSKHPYSTFYCRLFLHICILYLCEWYSTYFVYDWNLKACHVPHPVLLPELEQDHLVQKYHQKFAIVYL